MLWVWSGISDQLATAIHRQQGGEGLCKSFPIPVTLLRFVIGPQELSCLLFSYQKYRRAGGHPELVQEKSEHFAESFLS